MAYATEGDAGFRLTAASTTGGTFNAGGLIGVNIETIFNREVIKADANNYPVSRPVDEIDARATVEFLGTDDAADYTIAAVDLVVTFNQADGGTTGSITVGKMLPGSVTHSMRRSMGGFSVQQTFELQGALTYTVVA